MPPTPEVVGQRNSPNTVLHPMACDLRRWYDGALARTVRTMINVALAGDEPIMVEALCFSIDAEADMTVRGAFSSGSELVRSVQRQDFDVALLDLGLDGNDDLSVLSDIRLARPELPVVILSSFDHRDYVEPALAGGARGYLLKRSTRPELLDSIRAVAAGGSVLSPEIASQLIATVARSEQTPEPRSQALLGLTERGAEVLRLVAQGLSNEEIARDLGIVTATVKVHVSKLLRRTKTKNRVELVIFAFDQGFVRPSRCGEADEA